MKLEFVITEAFEQDMNNLSQELQSKIKADINLASASLLNGKISFLEKASMPYIFNLKDGLDSSLYVVRVGDDKKMIAAIDDDPIFDRILLTMYRLTDPENAETAYKEVGDQLYKSTGLLKS